MAQEKDKKTLIILLAILGVACIVSALWIYNSFKIEPISLENNGYSDLELVRLNKLKDMASDNIKDFLKMENFYPESIWDNFYQAEQYLELTELEIEINTWDDIGNPYPFASTATSTIEDEFFRD